MNRYAAFLLVINFTFAFCVKESFFKSFDDNERECALESDITDCELRVIKRQDVVREDKTAEAFAACMLKKLNVLNEDGSINESVLRDALVSSNDQEEIDIVSKCSDLAAKDANESARKVLTCLLQNIHTKLTADAEKRKLKNTN